MDTSWGHFCQICLKKIGMCGKMLSLGRKISDVKVKLYFKGLLVEANFDQAVTWAILRLCVWRKVFFDTMNVHHTLLFKNIRNFFLHVYLTTLHQYLFKNIIFDFMYWAVVSLGSKKGRLRVWLHTEGVISILKFNCNSLWILKA